MIVLITSVILLFGHIAGMPQIFFRDDFKNLNNWEKISFGTAKDPTKYTIQENGGETWLSAVSESSASGLLCREFFDAGRFPRLRWRWNIGELVDGASGADKAGDDYAWRIFVLFKKDPAETSFWDDLAAGFVQLISGYRSPHSSLVYVWGNTAADTLSIVSPYDDSMIIIRLRAGSDSTSLWLEESVNIREDYKKYFDRLPPAAAKLALMCDSDNAASSARAALDYIEVGRP